MIQQVHLFSAIAWSILNANRHYGRGHQTRVLKFLQQQERFDTFCEVYNNQRPHEPLNV